jgi:hypothetical protein
MSGIDGSVLIRLEQVDPDEAAALEEELIAEDSAPEEEEGETEYTFDF